MSSEEIKDLSYEETIELEKNIAIKKKAMALYKNFNLNVSLDVSKYRGEGRFHIWNDSHNATYLAVGEKYFTFQCRFLHESYDVIISPGMLFKYIKSDYRGLGHFQVFVKGCQK